MTKEIALGVKSVNNHFTPGRVVKAAVLASVVLVALSFFVSNPHLAFGCQIGSGALVGSALLYVAIRACSKKALYSIQCSGSNVTVRSADGLQTMTFPCIEIPVGKSLNLLDPSWNTPVESNQIRYIIFKHQAEAEVRLLRQTSALVSENNLMHYANELMNPQGKEHQLLEKIPFVKIEEVSNPPALNDLNIGDGVYVVHAGTNQLTLYLRSSDGKELLKYEGFTIASDEHISQTHEIWKKDLHDVETQHVIYRQNGELYILSNMPSLIDKSQGALFSIDKVDSSTIAMLSRRSKDRTVIEPSHDLCLVSVNLN